jgi:Holliday junction resolvasome RuvABC DNA-binding subunit
MLLSIKEILAGPKVSNYQGSELTRDMVAKQIEEIWGKSELKNYSPEKSALPFTTWLHLGYKPKKGSKALKSVTYVEKKDAKGKIIKRYSRKINLFYYRSVEPITD